ncbi:MAG TPA: hypothetical protein VHW23_36800 [Kofleriaceae bacterium]|nr:hypothetical protein [Kofleriaceae bacterium]
MKKKPLQVSLHVREPSVVEMSVGERVQLDRLTPSPRGYLAERHGRLLAPGTTTVALEPGHYGFQTLSDAHLRVVTGGVSTAIDASSRKDPPPPRPLSDPPSSGDDVSLPVPTRRGDDAVGERPRFTIEHT